MLSSECPFRKPFTETFRRGLIGEDASGLPTSGPAQCARTHGDMPGSIAGALKLVFEITAAGARASGRNGLTTTPGEQRDRIVQLFG